MTLFSLLPAGYRMGLAGILFLAVLGVQILCIYKYVCTSSVKKALPEAALFAALVPLCAYVSAAAEVNNAGIALNLPWGTVPLVSLLIVIYCGIGLWKARHKSEQLMAPSCVRKALDELNVGLCFADEDGKIILLNHTMIDFSHKLLGRFPLSLDEILRALQSGQNCRQLSESKKLYRFADGSVWKADTVCLDEPSLAGFTQTTVQELTALYQANEQLHQENEQLRATNEQMEQMYKRLADRIREQETLDLKMKIHNDIGTSLIKIRDMMEGENTQPMEEDLARLEHAVSFFSNDRVNVRRDLQATEEQARQMKVALLSEGELPENERAVQLVLAACRECVTNCVKHAGGNTVWLKMKTQNGVFSAHITNNGKPPKVLPPEGGGLSSLRKKAADIGFEMEICIEHGFELILRKGTHD